MKLYCLFLDTQPSLLYLNQVSSDYFYCLVCSDCLFSLYPEEAVRIKYFQAIRETRPGLTKYWFLCLSVTNIRLYILNYAHSPQLSVTDDCNLQHRYCHFHKIRGFLFQSDLELDCGNSGQCDSLESVIIWQAEYMHCMGGLAYSACYLKKCNFSGIPKSIFL